VTADVNVDKLQKAHNSIVRQARKVVEMRRKQSLWKDLEPELRKLGATVRELEKLERDGKS
jgi:hypothetical protein